VIQRFDPQNAGQIVEGVNGSNYKTGEEMAGKITEICQMTAEEKQQMKERVRGSMSHSGPEDMANHLLQVYENALKKRRKSRRIRLR